MFERRADIDISPDRFQVDKDLLLGALDSETGIPGLRDQANRVTLANEFFQHNLFNLAQAYPVETHYTAHYPREADFISNSERGFIQLSCPVYYKLEGRPPKMFWVIISSEELCSLEFIPPVSIYSIGPEGMGRYDPVERESIQFKEILSVALEHNLPYIALRGRGDLVTSLNVIAESLNLIGIPSIKIDPGFQYNYDSERLLETTTKFPNIFRFLVRVIEAKKEIQRMLSFFKVRTNIAYFQREVSIYAEHGYLISLISDVESPEGATYRVFVNFQSDSPIQIFKHLPDNVGSLDTTPLDPALDPELFAVLLKATLYSNIAAFVGDRELVAVNMGRIDRSIRWLNNVVAPSDPFDL